MKPLAIELRPTQRRWRDLGKRRLFLGLTAAPIPSVLVGFVLLLIFVIGPGLPRRILMLGSALLLAAVLWSLFAGSIYLLVISRRRGILSRVECLVLGIVAAFIFPPIVELLSGLIDWITIGQFPTSDDPWDNPDMTHILEIALAIILMPFGLLGGWVFWTVGVRPAITTVGDVAPVFD